MRHLMLILMIISLAKASTLVVDGKSLEVKDTPYVTRCILGTTWIQFLNISENKAGGAHYELIDTPKQVYRATYQYTTPIPCKDVK